MVMFPFGYATRGNILKVCLRLPADPVEREADLPGSPQAPRYSLNDPKFYCPTLWCLSLMAPKESPRSLLVLAMLRPLPKDVLLDLARRRLGQLRDNLHLPGDHELGDLALVLRPVDNVLPFDILA